MKFSLPIFLALFLFFASCSKTKVYWISPMTRTVDIEANYQSMHRIAEKRLRLSESDSLYSAIKDCTKGVRELNLEQVLEQNYPPGTLPFGLEKLDAVFGQPMIKLTINEGPVCGKIVINKHGLLIHDGNLFKLDSVCCDDIRTKMIERFDLSF